jgi:signal transduction histidine kinase
MARPQQIHGTRTRESLDKVFLAAAFIAGAVGIVWLKQLDIEPWWAALFAGGVLVSYAFATWFNRNLALEPETIGDNSYYLGFIFTLISLGATLYQMTGTGTEVGILRDVIAGFGVALSSTIIGVFLRVFMMQLRTDVVARDRHARLELNDASREFRLRLAESVAQMKAFSTEAVQLAGETNSRIQAANETFHKDHRDRMSRATDDYNKALTDLMAASSAIITRDLKASIDEVLGELRREVGASLDRLRVVTEATVKLQENEVAGQAARISTAATEAREAHDAIKALSDLLRTATRNATKASEAVETAASDISGGVSRAVADVEAAARQAEAALSLRKLGPALERPVAALEEAARRIEAASRMMEQRTDSTEPDDRPGGVTTRHEPRPAPEIRDTDRPAQPEDSPAFGQMRADYPGLSRTGTDRG